MAPLMGAHHLMRPGGGRGVLVCGVPGVRSAKVVILGAGVAGMAAATLAVGMHSEVYILDRNLERLRQVDHHFRGALETVASSTHAIEECCIDADIVIGAVLVVGAKAPKLVSDDLVARMRARGRSWSTSRSTRAAASSRPGPPPTPHPTFEVDGSLFYCVANMPGAVPHYLDPRPGQRHAALRAGDRRPRLAGRGARRRGPGRGGQRGRRLVVYGPVADAHGCARFPWPPSSTDREWPAVSVRFQSAKGSRARRRVSRAQVFGDPDTGTQCRIGNRIEADRPQGDLARPDAELGVWAVAVIGRTAPDLHRALVEGHPQDGRGRQLPVRRRAGILPLPGGGLVADGPEADPLLVGVGSALLASRRPWHSGS